MGSLVVPGPTTGAKGSPTAPQETHTPPFSQWFPSFLRDELRPYPGRSLLALRYVLAATVTMLVIVTFRLPGAAVGGFYSLLLPRESPSATAKSAVALLLAFGSSMAFVVTGTMLFVNYPLTHFLWVIGSFFVGFTALSVLSNYAAASAFTILIVLAVPAWDAPLPTVAIVISNLWVAGSVAVAIGATLLVEAIFALFETTTQLDKGLVDRLSAVVRYLQQSGEAGADVKAREKLQQLAVVGVSRLRRLALSTTRGSAEVARQSTVVSLVGRIVDLVATMEQVERFSPQEKPRLSALARQLHQTRRRLEGVDSTPAEPLAQPVATERPILVELEKTATLLQFSLFPPQGATIAPDLAQPAAPSFFVADAWSNPDHLRFALRGCLALMVCYITLNAVAWPGLGPSLFTVVVTALSSVGSSRQKQLLRVSGAFVGGVVLGMGSQVLILPMLDSLAGFLVMFVAVTCVAAWFITASPRLSYFGTQMALAFFLVHLRGPSPQTNLAIARDNIMGIFLGLIVMWLVFDQLGSKPAAVVMRELFATNLKLMAELATPWPGNQRTDLGKVRALRDKVSQNFSAVNAQADAVLFELGRSRAASLKVRNLLLGWQPRLRSIFLVQVALLQYRGPLSPSELPEEIVRAQGVFDAHMRAILKGMASVFSDRVKPPKPAPLGDALGSLRDAVYRAYQGKPTPRAAAVLALSGHLEQTVSALNEEMHRAEQRTRLG